MPSLLTGFRSVQPKRVQTQRKTLDWLAAAHTQAEATRALSQGRAFDEERFRDQVTRHLARFGCDETQILARGSELDDCSHTRWSDMRIYRLVEHAQGEGALARTEFFTETTEKVLERLYAEQQTPPTDLLHVTCTGYASPSAAQRMVAKRGWGADTRVTHVYHMGCYAAFPALRIGEALLAAPAGELRERRCDIVHTEICSLHVDPLAHTPEQLVVQTLFADGFIAYHLCAETAWDRRSPGFQLLAQDELIVSDTSQAMTWVCSDWGMRMSLSRDVPEHLAQALRPFVTRLLSRAGLDGSAERHARFAIHPGGPKILDRARAVLELTEAQVLASKTVLRDHGNMSSATLPHVWMEMANDSDLEAGALVVSLAFGPGLTICGAVMRKVAP